MADIDLFDLSHLFRYKYMTFCFFFLFDTREFTSLLTSLSAPVALMFLSMLQNSLACATLIVYVCSVIKVYATEILPISGIAVFCLLQTTMH